MRPGTSTSRYQCVFRIVLHHEGFLRLALTCIKTEWFALVSSAFQQSVLISQGYIDEENDFQIFFNCFLLCLFRFFISTASALRCQVLFFSGCRFTTNFDLQRPVTVYNNLQQHVKLERNDFNPLQTHSPRSHERKIELGGTSSCEGKPGRH